MSSSPSYMTFSTLLKLGGPVSSSEQGASQCMFIHSFAAYCTVPGMGEKEEFLTMCWGGRHAEGQERASLGFQRTQSPRHRPAAPKGFTCSWRQGSEKEFRNMSLHFGLFRLPGPCSTPWVGELQPSGFPDLADAFHITISVEKIENHPNSLLNKFLIFPLYSPWKSLSLPLLKYQHTNHKCTRLNFYQVNTHTTSTQLKEEITSPLASPLQW